MCFGDSSRFLIGAFKKAAYYEKFQIHIQGERTVDCPSRHLSPSFSNHEPASFVSSVHSLHHPFFQHQIIVSNFQAYYFINFSVWF